MSLGIKYLFLYVIDTNFVKFRNNIDIFTLKYTIVKIDRKNHNTNIEDRQIDIY